MKEQEQGAMAGQWRQTDRSFMAQVFFWLCLGYGVVSMLDIFPFQLDDAYIAWRYSQNYLQQGLFSFNPSGPEVEGFSSPIWFWLGVLWGRLAGVASIHYGGVIAGVGSYLCLVALYRLGSGSDKSVSAILAALVAMVSGNISYAVTGLETVFFVLLVNVFAFSLLGKTSPVMGLLVAILAGWTRPEAPWLLVMLLIALVVRPCPSHVKQYWKYALGVLLGYGSLLVFRQQIFQDWFPNTYYEKEPDVWRGLAYLKDAFLTPWFSALFLAATLSTLIDKSRASIAAYLMACSWLVAGVLEGGDWMSGFRFFLPGISLLVLPLYPVLARLYEAGARLQKTLPVLVCLLVFVGSSVMTTQETIKRGDNQLVMGNLEYLWVKQWLLGNGLDSIAAVDIGELGYSSLLTVLDLGGLTDAYIAGLPGRHMDKTIPVSYILDKSPDVVLIRLERKPASPRLSAQDIMTPVEAGLLLDATFREYYQPVFIVAPPYQRYPYYGLMLMLHRSVDRKAVLNNVPAVLENGIPFVYLDQSAGLFVK